MIYKVRLLPEAEDDLFELHRYISRKSSAVIAENYIARIKAFLAGFDQFPHGGTVRKDKRPGLRIVGFGRRVSVAFTVTGDEVRPCSKRRPVLDRPATHCGDAIASRC